MNLSDVTAANQKVLIWATHTSAIEFRLEEHVYRLERDEAKMLKRLKETNLRATGVGGFLLEKAGPSKEVDKSLTHSLDGLIDKKKIFESSRVIMAGQPLSVSKMQITVEPTFELVY